MDSFELNKIAGAVLGTGLLVMALSILSEAIYEPEAPEKPGYVIAVPETEEGGGPAGGAPEVPPIAARLQTADASAGESSARKCQACHTFEKGGPAKVGPNLYGIVGNQAAHMEGFQYSTAMTEKNSEGMTWTFEELDKFLENPKAEVPGTAMAFAGLKKPDERANVIAYLRTLSDSPVPLPPPPEEAAPAEGADASGAPPAPEGGEAPPPEGGAAPGASQAPEAPVAPSEPSAQPAAPEAPVTGAETAPAAPNTDAAPAPSGTTPPATPETPPSATAPESPPAAPPPGSSGQ